jgi:hypothetical protein
LYLDTKQYPLGGEDNGILAVSGGNEDSAKLDDGDGYFDLDNLEYASDF